MSLAALLIRVVELASTVHMGRATTFYPQGDPWNPDPHLACTGRDLTDRDVVVAHPTLPCGSRVLIYAPRTGRSVVATVADRGPKRALVDLSPATARALRANGEEQVVMVELR